MSYFNDEILSMILEVKQFYIREKKSCSHKEKMKFLLVTLSSERSKVGKCGYIWCKNESKFTCSKCKTVKYCSKECSVKFWMFHKEECKFIRVRGNIKNICLTKIECKNFDAIYLMENLMLREKIKEMSLTT